MTKLSYDLLVEKSILKKIDYELRKQGYAGETDIPKIVFLAAHSRHRQEPVSLVVMGPSGSGKTHGIDSGLQFIPPAAIEAVSGMSEKALPYYSGDSLKNRVLYLGEAAGMAEGNGRTFLRQLMTEGKIRHLTVQKTASGMKGEQLSPVEGPIAFMMATTANHIHHEDQSRMLVLNMDEDPARIRDLLINQSMGQTKRSYVIDTAPWFALDEAIGSHKAGVRIPYARKLSELVPIRNIKISRDFPKVLAMIETCALVHQFSRDKDVDGAIIANEDDYFEIYKLLNKPLSHGLEASVKDGVKTIVKAVEEYSKKNHSMPTDGISQSKIATITGIERSVVSRNVFAAISQGYLINKNPGQGREASVILGDRPLSEENVLPSPDKLFKVPVVTSKAPW